MTDGLMHCNFKEVYSSQVAEGQSVINTCVNKCVTNAYDSLTLANNIDSQYRDFIMWGRGLSGNCVNNITSVCNQNIDNGRAYDCVRCDFISLLGHVNKLILAGVLTL